MTEHAIFIQPQPSTVTASTLAELLKQTGTNTLQFTEALGINYRTAQRRIQEPETMTLTELWGLSALLKVSEAQLVHLIRDEVKNRPPQAGKKLVQEPSAPAEKKTPAKKPPGQTAAEKSGKA